jgi:hypothetical protein
LFRPVERRTNKIIELKEKDGLPAGITCTFMEADEERAPSDTTTVKVYLFLSNIEKLQFMYKKKNYENYVIRGINRHLRRGNH